MKYTLFIESDKGFIHPEQFTDLDSAIEFATKHVVEGEEAFCILDEQKQVQWSILPQDFDSRIIMLLN